MRGAVAQDKLDDGKGTGKTLHSSISLQSQAHDLRAA
jgi:hypothetical protein